MVPGTTTGPGENRENLDRRPGEATNHGEQVRHTRNFCDGLTKNDASFKNLIQEYHQKGKTRDQVKEEFKKRLRLLPKPTRDKMGIVSAGDDVTESEIETFLTQTGCFDNQLMAQIESDVRGKEKANENMITSCLEVAHDEYGNFDETELKKSLKKEDMGRLRTFLETPKYRKTYLSKLPGSNTLKEKDFSDINFEEITKAIANLKPTDPKRGEIQEAWLKIAHVAHPESNLASAFHDISHGGGEHKDIAGAYGAFFSDSNTCISRENREKILNFLVRQYTPVVPLSVLEVIDPKTSKKYLTSEIDKAEIEKDLPSDPELAEALKRDREEQWEKTYKTYIGGQKSMIGARSLPFETKVRILSQFGSIGKAEKMREYYRGKPGSLRSSTNTEGEFREKFQQKYDIDTEKLDIKSGLTEELIAKLGHRIDGMEHFDDGCVMEWKTKNKNNEEITGYYIVDSVPSEDMDEDNIITMRFLGDNRDPLSANGLAHHYTGADFYDYLSGCAEDGKITFRERSEFDAEIEKNTRETKSPRYFTEAETKSELRAQFPEVVEVQSFEEFNAEVDKLLNPSGNNPKEAKSAPERTLHKGMIFCKTSSGTIDTFQIQDIDPDAGTITLWDGWGTGKKSVIEMPFADFLRTLKSMKQGGSEVHRLPTGGKKIDPDVFNTLCKSKEQYNEGIGKKIGRITLREENGHMVFGQFDEKTANFTAFPVVKIGDKKDLYIESIGNDGIVNYRVGTFTQGESDKEKGIWKKKPGFRGSPPLTMSLEMLWAYLQNNGGFSLTKPKEKPEIDEKKEKSKPMSWWNILMHSHSWGVILHGDLWKSPFKAWEEQHHKDHAFHGKITAALAIEKLQSGYGPLSGILNWAEWPSLMVADGNGTLQSYLDELVNKIDGMGSYHRTRLIKKWSRTEHFPAPKFMAAMFASMKIFGQLYPYDFGDNEGEGKNYRNKDGSHEWFWYNSICHSLDPHHSNPKKFPHMPPHGDSPWPERWVTKDGYKMNEVDACFELFGKFEHPMLRNLGRRFQKYMNGGQKELADGGEGNLKQRTTMTEKLDWMMGAAVGSTGKPPELFGASTELWLAEGYPVAVTTMPYAALLFGHREEQMLSPTREHIKEQFQTGTHIPMFVFMQNKDLGDIFRKTGIAFAYTISEKCGENLEDLVKRSGNKRLSGDVGKDWIKEFQKFWEKYGKELMYKFSGMKDPLLNLMINDSKTFDKVLEGQDDKNKKQYARLSRDRNIITAYYDRLAGTFDSPSHAAEPRNKGYYSGDIFRFRDDFDSGFGNLSWVNWDAYLDANLDKDYAAGGGANTDGDGVFKEMREFFYQIPRMASEMAKNMGFPGNKEKINMIARSIYESNIAKIKACDGIKKIKADKADVAYCSMSAMMLGMIDIKQISKDASPDNVARFGDLKEKMHEAIRVAKEMENNNDFVGAIKYRKDMAEKFRSIVEGEINTRGISLHDIYNTANMQELTDEGAVKKTQYKTQARSGTVLTKKKEEFDSIARTGENTVEPNNIVQFPGMSQQRNMDEDNTMRKAA